MAVIQSGADASLLSVTPTHKAAHVVRRPLEGDHFSISARSGLMAGIAADAPIFSFRWGSATKAALIHRVRAKFYVVSGFTAAQEVAAALSVARGFSASHASGTALTLTTNNAKRRTSFATTALTSARVADAAALSGGTATPDANPIATAGASALAAAATVPNAVFEFEKDFSRDDGGPLQLVQDEGLIINNLVLLGAGGTVRMAVDVDWSEVGTGAGW